MNKELKVINAIQPFITRYAVLIDKVQDEEELKEEETIEFALTEEEIIEFALLELQLRRINRKLSEYFNQQ